MNWKKIVFGSILFQDVFLSYCHSHTAAPITSDHIFYILVQSLPLWKSLLFHETLIFPHWLLSSISLSHGEKIHWIHLSAWVISCLFLISFKSKSKFCSLLSQFWHQLPRMGSFPELSSSATPAGCPVLQRHSDNSVQRHYLPIDNGRPHRVIKGLVQQDCKCLSPFLGWPPVMEGTGS